ncbi:MAG: IPT/TIG domain-containing protein [Myxococcales bacterium]
MTRGALIAFLLCACGHESSALDGGLDAGEQADGGTTTTGGNADGGPGAPITVKVRVALPATGKTKGGETVLVSGSGFVNGFAVRGGSDVSRRTTVTFGGTPATNVNVIDDNRVEVIAPAGAPGSVDVKVTNPNGTGACAGCYRYVTPIAVTAVEPARGPSLGGTSITVHGQGFTSDLLLTIGGRELIGLSIVDGQTATGSTPPGSEGGADVLALSPDGMGQLRRGFVYQDALRVDSVSPGVVGTTGGDKLVIAGAGFSAISTARIDGAAAPSEWVDDQHLALFAPAHPAGAVDVSVDGATLAGGLVYADPGGATTAYGVQPSHGPLAGAIVVHVYGTGLTGVTSAAFGTTPASVHPVSDVQLDVDLPAGAAPGAVDVQVASQTLNAAFTYDPPLAVASISPASGPAAGGTQVTIAGAGLANAQVFIGALEAPVAGATDGSVTATTSAGSPGPADVMVVSGGLSARLAGAFTYTAPTSLTQVSPALGAQAGGTKISLYGRGFTAAVSASVGGAPVTGLQLISPTQATALTPPGTPGAKPVVVGGFTLPNAFTYFDPALEQGGGSGGPLLGVLNLTVLEDSAFKTGGVQGATVQVVLHDGTALTGLTDANGQVTFSDDRLVLPAQVTAVKDQYDSITIDQVGTSNLTVALEGPAGAPPPPPGLPPPPPQPLRPATVGGHVFGFKLAPGTALSPTQKAVARVSIARSGIYALPPFAGAVAFFTVNDDGGPYTFSNLYSLSPTTFYAVFGIEDTATNPSTFTPLLLGVLRGVRPDPAKTIADADIILDTHLDQSVDVTVLDPPSASGGHDAFLDLDLGQAGAIPLGRALQNSDPFHLHFSHLPVAAGQGFVFVAQYGRWTGNGITTPVTTYLRRVFGDISGGVTIGPLLPFPAMQKTGPDLFSWTTGPSALQPNLQQLRVQDGTSQQDTSWSVLLPGDATQIAMPGPVRARLQPGVHGFSIVTSVAPSFDFAHWTYSDLFSGNWTAYAFADGTFTAP